MERFGSIGGPARAYCVAMGLWVGAGVLLAGCGDDGGGRMDASSDGGGMDGATRDGAVDGGVDGGQGLPFPLPVYRLGQRAASSAFFAQDPFEGTIRLPVDTAGLTTFAGWAFFGHGPTSEVTLGTESEQDGDLVAEITVRVDTDAELPAMEREIFTAVAPDGTHGLSTVLDADGELHFSPESSARQALSLAGIRQDDTPLENVYYSGLREGDDASVDAAVSEVASAIRARAGGDGTTGIGPQGFAIPGTDVFTAVDQAIADPSLKRPTVTVPSSTQHIGVLHVAEPAGHGAMWLGPRAPSVHFGLPEGIDQVGFFFGDTLGGPYYARTRTLDGRQSPASAPFEVDEPTAQGPASPTVTETGDGFEACGAEPEQWVLFLEPSTELAVGFHAARAGDDGCALLRSADIPSEVASITAVIVRRSLRVGAPAATAAR